MSLSVAFAGVKGAAESRRSSRLSELWNITGAGDTGAAPTITTRYVRKPEAVIGACTFSISGRVVTCTVLAALTGTTTIEIIGSN